MFLLELVLLLLLLQTNEYPKKNAQITHHPNGLQSDNDEIANIDAFNGVERAKGSRGGASHGLQLGQPVECDWLGQPARIYLLRHRRILMLHLMWRICIVRIVRYCIVRIVC